MTRAWVEIDLGALRRNGAALRARAGVPLLPMVKADAYGLGAVAVARELERLDPWGFGVATVDEGRELREAGVARPVVVFTPLLADDFAGAREARLTPALADPDDVRAWGDSGPWHLAIDTGMSRAGVRWDEVSCLADVAAAFPPEGAFTHFHSADQDDDSMAEQERRFERSLACLSRRPRWLHAENSAALIRRSPSRWDLARPGVFLYGVGCGAGAELSPDAVVHLRARILEVRVLEDGESVSYGATYRAAGRRRIATAGLGYGDGYRRAFSNRAEALVRGRRVRVAGAVTMDMTMLDVTDAPCEVGDVATFLGRDGDALLDVVTLASAGDVFPYELLTGLRARLPRLYVGESSG